MTMTGNLAFLMIVLLALAGCGSGGGDGGDLGQPKLETPEFDLTGIWQTTESDCQSYGDEPSDSELAQLEPGVLAEGEEDLWRFSFVCLAYYNTG